MDHADVLHALREAGGVKDSLGDDESNTMERLRDGQVKLGVPRYKQYAGSQRRIVNQIRTGVVSRHTLLNVLERGQWVCPVCKDDNLSIFSNLLILLAFSLISLHVCYRGPKENKE
jgi:hypothetical protein